MWIPERLTREQIELRSDRLLIQPLLQAVGSSYLIERGMSFELLYEHVIAPHFGIEIRENANLGESDGLQVLGKYNPLDDIAFVDSCLAAGMRDPRRCFTLYHEVCGHGVLQGRWLRGQKQDRLACEPLVDTSLTLELRNKEELERQANIMAGVTAAPMWLVNCQIYLRLQLNRVLLYSGYGEYWLGPHSRARKFQVVSFEDYCLAIASFLKPYFGGLSQEALGYRVQRSRLVRDYSRLRVVRHSHSIMATKGGNLHRVESTGRRHEERSSRADGLFVF